MWLMKIAFGRPSLSAVKFCAWALVIQKKRFEPTVIKLLFVPDARRDNLRS